MLVEAWKDSSAVCMHPHRIYSLQSGDETSVMNTTVDIVKIEMEKSFETRVRSVFSKIKWMALLFTNVF